MANAANTTKAAATTTGPGEEPGTGAAHPCPREVAACPVDAATATPVGPAATGSVERDDESGEDGAATGTGRQLRAVAHECVLYATAHPLLWPLSLALRGLPLVRIPGLGVVVSDAETIGAILRRDRDFIKTGPGSMGPVYDRVLGPSALLNMDGPPHRALRARLAGVFSPAGVATSTAAVFAVPLGAVAAALAAGEPVDLADLARDLTGRMTCRLLGLAAPPGAERATALRVSALAERLTGLVPLSRRAPSPRQVAALRDAVERLTETARAGFDDPALPPTALIRQLREAGLGFEEARGVLAALLVVGTQTVAVALPRIVALLVDTGQWALLRRRPDLLPGAIDEGLRCTAPTPATLRAVAHPTSIGGRHLVPGERVFLLTHNAAKDPRLFPRPWRFDPTRRHPPAARHLWFGAGPHFCLGFALAHEELRLALSALLAVPGDIVIVGRTASHGILPRYERLIIRARATDPAGPGPGGRR